MPLLRRNGNPSPPGGSVPHIASEDEREQQRQKENPKKYYRQLSPSASDQNVGACHLPRHKVLQQRRCCC